jgi:RNA polymerase sigma-70 factor (ECF subfamily)
MYALHLTNDSETSRDIVSDVLSHLWENIRTIDKETVHAYLTTAVRNKCIDHLRHQIVINNYFETYLQEAEQFYTDYPKEMENEHLVKEMLEELPPVTRHILEECYLYQNKYSEVAEKMNINPNTVKKHISKALKILREKFNSENKLTDIPKKDTKTYNK